MRLNGEVIFANHSPVGYRSYAVDLGANEMGWTLSFEVFF